MAGEEAEHGRSRTIAMSHEDDACELRHWKKGLMEMSNHQEQILGKKFNICKTDAQAAAPKQGRDVNFGVVDGERGEKIAGNGYVTGTDSESPLTPGE